MEYALARSEASTIVVCCSREDFLTRISVELEAQDPEGLGLLSNTLSVLSLSSQVRTVFVSETIQMRAYLSSMTEPDEPVAVQ